MAEQKFLDYEGLSTFKNLLTKYIDEEDAKSLKSMSLSNDGKEVYFYKVENPDRMTQPAYTLEFPDVDVSGLMELVASAIEGNIAVFDANGQVIDGGTAISDLATAEYVGTIPAGYEATTIAEYAKELADNVAANGYDDTDIKARLTKVESDITTLNGDEDVEGSVAQQIADAEDELMDAIDTAVANAGHLKREIVDELPDVSEADELTIYMLAKDSDNEGDSYDEYMVINGSWEKIGNTDIDLSDYATTEYVDSKASEEAESALDSAKEYADSLADNYDAAGTAQDLVTALEEGQVATNTKAIEELQDDEKNADTYVAITDSEIEALF